MNPPKPVPDRFRNAMNWITSTFSLLLKRYSPAQKPPGANPKGRRQLTTPPRLRGDKFTRLLQRQSPDTEALWQEAKELVDKERGLLVVDDTTLDKLYAKKMGLGTYHWSGKHPRVVRGINLQTLLWSDGKALIPCDFRV